MAGEYINDEVFDGGLDYLDAITARVDITSQVATTYGNATTTDAFSLGNKTGLAISVPGNASSGTGRSVTVAAITDGTVTTATSATATSAAAPSAPSARVPSTGDPSGGEPPSTGESSASKSWFRSQLAWAMLVIGGRLSE